MLKALGVVLLMGGCIGVGLGKIRGMDRRINALRAFLCSLEVIERELDFRLSPMDELLQIASQGTPEPISGLLKKCSDELRKGLEYPFSELWGRLVREHLTMMTKNDLECILSLGSILGRYDTDGQRQAVERVRTVLTQSLMNALSERKGQGKVYGVLGATTGAFLVILLL